MQQFGFFFFSKRKTLAFQSEWVAGSVCSVSIFTRNPGTWQQSFPKTDGQASVNMCSFLMPSVLFINEFFSWENISANKH